MRRAHPTPRRWRGREREERLTRGERAADRERRRERDGEGGVKASREARLDDAPPEELLAWRGEEAEHERRAERPGVEADEHLGERSAQRVGEPATPRPEEQAGPRVERERRASAQRDVRGGRREPVAEPGRRGPRREEDPD